MKFFSLVSLAGCLCFLIPTRAGAQLLPNGNFELGTISPINPGPNAPSGIYLDPAVSLPCWNVGGDKFVFDVEGWHYGGSITPPLMFQSEISYGASVSLLTNGYYSLGAPFEGNRTIQLQAGDFSSPGVTAVASASIWQVVNIPLDAKSIVYRVGMPDGYGGAVAVINGEYQEAMMLSFSPPTSSSPFQFLFAMDVTPFAGSNIELRFTALPTLGPLSGERNRAFLDEIAFSSIVVPEPSIITLIALGIFVVKASRRKSKRHSLIPPHRGQ